MRSVSRAAAQANAFPANVEPCRSKRRIDPYAAFCTRRVVIVTPIDAIDPPAAFARISRSGVASSCWNANIDPVRPKPVCASSTASSVPCSAQSVRAARR
jgi:hypothetical protein